VSSVELRSKAAIALADVLEQPQSTRKDLDRVIASSGTIERLINTFHGVFRDADVAEEYLANNMSLLTGFTGQTVHIDLVRRFSEMKTHREVMGALRRQLMRPKSGEEAWRVLEYSGMIVVWVITQTTLPFPSLTHCW
jgi:hypothetical protein